MVEFDLDALVALVNEQLLQGRMITVMAKTALVRISLVAPFLE